MLDLLCHILILFKFLLFYYSSQDFISVLGFCHFHYNLSWCCSLGFAYTQSSGLGTFSAVSCLTNFLFNQVLVSLRDVFIWVLSLLRLLQKSLMCLQFFHSHFILFVDGEHTEHAFLMVPARWFVSRLLPQLLSHPRTSVHLPCPTV